MVATLEGKIKMARDEAADKQRMADNAMSLKVAEAINKHSDDATPDEFGTGLSVMRYGGDPMIKLMQTAAEKKGTTSKAALDAGVGWHGMMYEYAKSERMQEMGTLYTSIEMAEDVAWTDPNDHSTAISAVSADTGDATIVADTNLSAMHLSGSVLPGAPSGATTTSRTEIPDAGQPHINPFPYQ